MIRLFLQGSNLLNFSLLPQRIYILEKKKEFRVLTAERERL